MIDLTPAAIGPYCIPPVNLREHVGTRAMDVNMVTCGGQATVPIVAAVSRVQPVAYGEIIATVASKSVGPGTRHALCSPPCERRILGLRDNEIGPERIESSCVSSEA